MLAPSDLTRVAFEAWRRTSAAHAEAYRRVSIAHDEAQSLVEQPALLSLRQQTLARTMIANERARRKPKIVAATILLLAAAPLAALGIHAWSPQRNERASGEAFRTGIGQQAEVTLPDGSIVTLDTSSRLEVRYTGDERHVSLYGQGWFRLKPSDKPFRISAGGYVFSADRGSFDVRTDPGRVRAFAADGPLTLSGGNSSVALPPGRLLAASGTDVTIRTLDDPASFTGWRNGLLRFDDVPLAEAASELNRYRRQPIRIADSRASALRVSGAFHTAETPAFVEALTMGFPVTVKEDSSEGVVIASR